MGIMTAVTPSIKRTLNMLEPTAFPIAMSALFFNDATTEVISSGRLVPIATTVSPIKASLIPKSFESAMALLRKIFAPILPTVDRIFLGVPASEW